MSTQTEAMKLALDALKKMARLTGPQWALENNYVGHLEALTALREALAEQPSREPLTLREIGAVCGNFSDEIVKVVRQTEAAHNIKENT